MVLRVVFNGPGGNISKSWGQHFLIQGVVFDGPVGSISKAWGQYFLALG